MVPWRQLWELQRARITGPPSPLNDLLGQSRFLGSCLRDATPDTDMELLSQAIAHFLREVRERVASRHQEQGTRRHQDLSTEPPPRYRPSSRGDLANHSEQRSIPNPHLSTEHPPPYRPSSRVDLASRSEQRSIPNPPPYQERAYQTTYGPILVPTVRRAALHALLLANSVRPHYRLPSPPAYSVVDNARAINNTRSLSPCREHHELLEGCDALELPRYELRNQPRQQEVLTIQQRLPNNRNARNVRTNHEEQVLHNPSLSYATLGKMKRSTSPDARLAVMAECSNLNVSDWTNCMASRFVIDRRNRVSMQTASQMGLLQRNLLPAAASADRRHTLPNILTVFDQAHEHVAQQEDPLSAQNMHINEVDCNFPSSPLFPQVIQESGKNHEALYPGGLSGDRGSSGTASKPSLSLEISRASQTASGTTIRCEHTNAHSGHSPCNNSSTRLLPTSGISEISSPTTTTSITASLDDEILEQEMSRYHDSVARDEIIWARSLQEQLDSLHVGANVERSIASPLQLRKGVNARGCFEGLPQSPAEWAIRPLDEIAISSSGCSSNESSSDSNCSMHLRGGADGPETDANNTGHAAVTLISLSRGRKNPPVNRYWKWGFINSRGNEYFCEIDEEYLTDRFNLTGLNTDVQYYQYALDLITDVFDLECEDDMREQIEKSARHLYGLVHARYIVTTRGQQKMMEKYKVGDFGKCPRVLCEGQNLLPMGQHDVAGTSAVKLYCARCEDLYNPKSSRHAAIDGAYFGTSFHNMLFQLYPHLQPPKTQRRYEPRIYGFKVHASAALARWQLRQRDGLKERLKLEGLETGFEEEEKEDEMEESEMEDEGQDGIDDMFEGQRAGPVRR